MAELTVINVKRKILWEPEGIPAPIQEEEYIVEQKLDGAPTHNLEIPEGSTLVVQPKRFYKKRIGNGHKSTKVRDLADSERDLMRHKLFLPKNGQIDDDDCKAFKKENLSIDVGVFQVTGFISVLHCYVAEGRMQVKDLVSYENWMRVKYGGSLWARYNHPLYVDVRQKNLDEVAQGKTPTHKIQKGQKIQISLTPKFTSFKKKWSKG